MGLNNTLSSAVSGLFRSYIAQQPKQNGVLDGLKIAQGESTINQNNASIAKSNAEADKITKRLRDLYDTEFQKNLVTGMLPTATPEQRAYSNLNSLRITDNPEQLVDAYGKGLGQYYFDKSLNDPEYAKKYNTASAAEKGNLYSPVGSTGLTLSQVDGGQNLGNQKLFDGTMGKIGSEIAENNAQAKKANADAKKTTFDTGKPKTTVILDGNGNPFIVNESASTMSPVSSTGGFVPKEDPVTKAAKTARAKDLQETLGNSRRTMAAINEYITILDGIPETGLGRDYQNATAYFGLGDEDKQAAMARAKVLEETLRISADKPPGAITEKEQAFLAGQMGVLTSPTATKAQKIAAAQQALAMYEPAIAASEQEFNQLGLGMQNPRDFAKTQPIQPNKKRDGLISNAVKAFKNKNIRTQQQLDVFVSDLRSKGFSDDEIRQIYNNATGN
jgi:hypothetical protein